MVSEVWQRRLLLGLEIKCTLKYVLETRVRLTNAHACSTDALTATFQLHLIVFFGGRGDVRAPCTKIYAPVLNYFPCVGAR